MRPPLYYSWYCIAAVDQPPAWPQRREPATTPARVRPEVAPRHRTPPPPAINCPSFPPRTPSIYLISPHVSPVVAFFTRVESFLACSYLPFCSASLPLLLVSLVFFPGRLRRLPRSSGICARARAAGTIRSAPLPRSGVVVGQRLGKEGGSARVVWWWCE
jgi:hypothetical protein